ncbi:MAG TPA: cobalamin-binding protein [Burkholderiales bacterium]|nr:cobalamin-binding protein [Burkholderiales bacterium]
MAPLALAAGIELRDDRGKTVALAAPAQRIVALAPHLAELAFAAGAGGRLVGAARFSDYPPEARGIARVGDAARVDLERIAALAPDLVLAWRSGNQVADVERLERLGYAVFVTEPQRLADIPRLTRAIGTLAGTSPEAERSAGAFERDVAALAARFERAGAVRVFYEIWHRPLITVNGRHLISDVLRICGGVNVFADAPLLTPTVSPEAVLAARPEAVIGGGSADTPQQFAAQWRRFPAAALRGLPVFHVHPDLIQRQTPRIVEGARAVCAALEKVRAGGRSTGTAGKDGKND